MTTQTIQDLSAQAHLKMLFAMNHSLLTKNLEGVTEELAMARPGDGNRIAWSLGHIVYWRQAVLGMLGGTPVWQEGDAEGFKGTSRDLPAAVDRGWAELLDAYRQSHARLIEALDENPARATDVLTDASQLQCHETYHIGQIALARRVVGLPGVI